MQSIEIEIYGKKYFLKSDDPENIKRCAIFLDKYISDVNRNLNIMDSSQLFLFSALFLSDEYLKLQDDFNALKQQFDRIESLLKINIK